METSCNLILKNFNKKLKTLISKIMWNPAKECKIIMFINLNEKILTLDNSCKSVWFCSLKSSSCLCDVKNQILTE